MKRERVTVNLAGRSAFSFSRVVKCICRPSLGLHDVDVQNAYFSVMVQLLGKDAPHELRRYVAERELCIEAMREALGAVLGTQLKREQIKQLIIGIGFGGSAGQSLGLLGSGALLRTPRGLGSS